MTNNMVKRKRKSKFQNCTQLSWTKLGCPLNPHNLVGSRGDCSKTGVLDLLTIGLVMDIWTEKGNDGTYSKKPVYVANQADFDRF